MTDSISADPRHVAQLYAQRLAAETEANIIAQAAAREALATCRETQAVVGDLLKLVRESKWEELKAWEAAYTE
jgi:hypothetical protein